MRRRMEAGVRHAQPAQAVAALQDLSTGASRPGRSESGGSSISITQHHAAIMGSEFPRQPVQRLLQKLAAIAFSLVSALERSASMGRTMTIPRFVQQPLRVRFPSASAAGNRTLLWNDVPNPTRAARRVRVSASNVVAAADGAAPTCGGLVRLPPGARESYLRRFVVAVWRLVRARGGGGHTIRTKASLDPHSG